MPAKKTPVKTVRMLQVLDESYPQAECALRHDDAFQLLVATILSAQCTDARVNLVTPQLFARYPTPARLAQAEVDELEAIIRSTGFFRAKARNLMGMARTLQEEFAGQVPRSMEELLHLPGVARKTANVVLGTAFGIADGVVVDTHVARISQRLGLTQHAEPTKIERDLQRILPRERWIAFSHQLILHGRSICQARKPRCAVCPLRGECAFAQPLSRRRSPSPAAP